MFPFVCGWNCAVFSSISLKTNFWAFMQLHYPLFIFISPETFFCLLPLNWVDTRKRFFCLFLANYADVSQTKVFSIFVASSSWWLFISPETFFCLLPLNWVDTRKRFFCLFLANYADVSQTKVFSIFVASSSWWLFIGKTFSACCN